MPSETFLPRVHSVFYTVFDVKQGPKIVCQVPEALIATSPSGFTSLSVSSSPKPSTPIPLEGEVPLSRQSSSSLISIGGRRPNSRQVSSPPHRSTSSTRVLFDFDDISKYVIPPDALCGRLVICATRNHRIIGFPVSISGSKYERNYFRFNLCFVFERSADLSCYKPIVRKVSRVLAACEEESMFLSRSSHEIYAILEQLYEDLNSYSETSIPIDEFNSIELKIFPFYPNPPTVKDWQVPVALINLNDRMDDNWDLTMKKVCEHINGVNHVRRIAQLADCDLELTRQAIAHLLYYQVIMTIDIFQYSNMYTLRKSVQWLADELHVKDECGPYVTKPGKSIPDWPRLLHLYSRFKPGKTVFEWMESYGAHDLGIDVRRFTSFGVIKGFLRRVHRYPVLLPSDVSPSNNRRRQSISSTSPQLKTHTQPSPTSTSTEPSRIIRGSSHALISSEHSVHSPTIETESSLNAQRRTSAAEKVLEQLHVRGSIPTPRVPTASSASLDGGGGNYLGRPIGRQRVNSDTQQQFTLHSSAFSSAASEVGEGIKRSSIYNPTFGPMSTSRSAGASRSPSVITVQQIHTPSPQGSVQTLLTPPPELMPLLDGEHHTDELATRFEAGWPLLQQWLVAIGGGKGNGDF